jgi:hypothetical protein
MKIQLKYPNELNLVLYSTLFVRQLGISFLYTEYYKITNFQIYVTNNTCITKLYNIHKMCTMECHDVQQNSYSIINQANI